MSSWMGNFTTSLPQQVVHPHCEEFPHTPLLGICPVATWSFCLAPPRNVWLHLLYSLPMGSWRCKFIRHPVNSSGWTSQPFSVSPCLPHAPALCSFGDPSLDSFQFVGVFLVSHYPGLFTILHRQPHKCQKGMGAAITSLDLRARLLLVFPSVSLIFVAIRAIAHSSLPLFTGTSQLLASWFIVLYPKVQDFMFALIELEEIHTGPRPQPFRVLLVTALALRESAASLNLMSPTRVTCWYLFALAGNTHCYWHADVISSQQWDLGWSLP